MPAFTPGEFAARIEKLQRELSQRAIDLLVLNENSDLYYYTGSVQPLYLLVPAQGQPVVLARKSITRIQQEVLHLPLCPFLGTKDLVAILTERGLTGAKRVAFTQDTTAYATVKRFQALLPEAEIVDFSWEIRALRMVKSAEELAIMRQAGAIHARMPEVLREAFTPGMTEVALSAALEQYFRLNGHGALIRCRREGIEMAGFGVCTVGENALVGTKFDGICGGKGLSPAMPFGATADPIRPNEPIIADFSFTLEGYHSDLTRMCCWGTPSEEVQRAYDAMVRIQRTLFDSMRPGQSWESVYLQSVQMAEEAGYADVYMGVGTEQVRFVGHGLGLELDEPPFLAPKMPAPLEAGMVIALEPKVALPGIGVVGIEDSAIIHEDGVEITTDCPTEIVRLK